MLLHRSAPPAIPIRHDGIAAGLIPPQGQLDRRRSHRLHWSVARDFPFIRLGRLVEVVEPLGAENLVTSKLGEHEVRGRFKPEIRPDVGARLSLALDPERFHLFEGETGKAL